MSQHATTPLADRLSGAPPIATCHWQLLADLLNRQGHVGFADRLGLAWGCHFPGPGVLFGAMAWPSVFSEVAGAVVSIERYGDQEAARRRELELSDRTVRFVAEVDEFYLPGSPQPGEHVVHAVSVLHRTNEQVHIVDLRTGPAARQISASDFDRMRSSPCHGRVEPYKLYALIQPPHCEATPDEVLSAVRSTLQILHPASTSALQNFIAWAETTDEPIDVCRAAGERFAATALFRLLDGEGIAGAAEIAARLGALTEDWYLVHMLGTRPQFDRRRRDRVVRLLNRVADAEREAAALVLL
jgi:hypothetical protein